MLAFVVIVSVDVPELLATEGGLNPHVAPLGNPAHESVTMPVNPKAGLTMMGEFAESPAVTGDGETEPARTPKPGAVVLNSAAIAGKAQPQ